MRIGITGDTHRKVQAIRQIVRMAPPVEMWLHTGDHAADANLLHSLSGLPVTSVTGNCDYVREAFRPDELLELEGFHIWLTHGHKYIDRHEAADMAWWARQLGADIAVYGHTHVPKNEYYGDTLLLNPGSPCRPRGGSQPCFAVLTLNAGEKPQAEFICLPSAGHGQDIFNF